jgi:hypothetical protein
MMTKNKSFVLLDALLVDPSYTLKPHKAGIKTHNDKNRKGDNTHMHDKKNAMK